MSACAPQCPNRNSIDLVRWCRTIHLGPSDAAGSHGVSRPDPESERRGLSLLQSDGFRVLPRFDRDDVSPRGESMSTRGERNPREPAHSQRTAISPPVRPGVCAKEKRGQLSSRPPNYPLITEPLETPLVCLCRIPLPNCATNNRTLDTIWVSRNSNALHHLRGT